MRIAVNPSDDLPIYRQIVRQVVEAIAGGLLEPGARVPSHRELSEELVIAPLTVKRAYDELESMGFLETQRGRGTFVASKPPKLTRASQLPQLREAARSLVAQAYLAGLALPDVIRLVQEADQDITPSPASRRRKDSSVA